MVKDLEMIKNLDIIFENKILMYGAGNCGVKTLKMLDALNISILGFCDSDISKWGKMVGENKIFSIQKLLEISQKEEIIIIITIEDPHVIEQVLTILDMYGLSSVSCYTYFALKHAIELHIDDERIPKSYQENLKIAKLIDRTHTLSYTELDGLAMIHHAMISDKSILLLQSGKVGSQSLAASLSKAQVDYRYAHMMAGSLWGNKFLKERLDGVGLLKKMEKNIKVISMVRDPISRDISTYFQLFGEYTLTDAVKADTLEGITTYLEENSKKGEFGWTFEWFNAEIREAFDIDVYQYDFDKERGYQIIKKNNVELLLIKTEKIDSCEKIIGQFIEKKDFKLVRENVGNDKIYKFAYNEAKKKIKIPERLIEFYYKGNKAMDHFYTMKEKEQYTKKWSSR